MPVPYAEHVGDRNPVELLTTTLEEYRDAAALLAEASWNQPWAPGKWTMRQVMVHVAQWEMIFGYRVMCAVATPGFTIQMADQDALLVHTAGRRRRHGLCRVRRFAPPEHRRHPESLRRQNVRPSSRIPNTAH